MNTCWSNISILKKNHLLPFSKIKFIDSTLVQPREKLLSIYRSLTNGHVDVDWLIKILLHTNKITNFKINWPRLWLMKPYTHWRNVRVTFFVAIMQENNAWSALKKINFHRSKVIVVVFLSALILYCMWSHMSVYLNVHEISINQKKKTKVNRTQTYKFTLLMKWHF